MRWITWILPTLLLSLVAAGWLNFATPLAVRGVKIFGGALAGGRHVSLRVEAWSDDGTSPKPLSSQTVQLRSSALGDSVATARTDDHGMAWLELDTARSLASSSLDASVRLGDGAWIPFALSVVPIESWAHDVRDAPWRATRRGALHVEVVPERAAFAVPFGQVVDVTASRDGTPVSAAVSARLEGRGSVHARRTSTTVAVDGAVTTAQFVVEPGEHDVALVVEARESIVGDDVSGTWYARIPVVPGAMDARLAAPSTLRVHSPVATERAYVAIIDERQRRWGGVASLRVAEDGTSTGDVSLPPRATSGRAWAVVSSEPRLDSAGAVGWPMGDAHGAPGPIRTASELLLADTFTTARQDEQLRQRRMQGRLLSSAVLAGVLAASWLFVGVRRARLRLGEHFSRAGAPRDEQRRWVDAQRTRTLSYGLMIVSLFAAAGIWFWIYWYPA